MKKKRKNYIKKTRKSINPIVDDKSFIAFCKRFIKKIKKGADWKKLSLYEKRITELIESKPELDNKNPLLKIIVRKGLERAEIKVLMYLIYLNTKMDRDREELENSIVSEEGDEDFEEIRSRGISAGKIINLFQNERDEVERAIFDADSRLVKNQIIEIRQNIINVLSDKESATVSLSKDFLKFLNIVRNNNIINKSIERIEVKKIKTDLYDILDHCINSKTASQLRGIIERINRIREFNKSCQIDDIIKFPVLVFLGNTEREKELVIEGIARVFESDIVVFKKDYTEDLDEFDFEECSEDYELEKFIKQPTYDDFVVRINLNSVGQLKTLSRIIQKYPDSRNKLIIATLNKEEEVNSFGIDADFFMTVEFDTPEEEVRKSLWIRLIPKKYYDGSGYDEFARRYEFFDYKMIELAVKKAEEEIKLAGKEKMEDVDIVKSAEELLKCSQSTIEGEDYDYSDISTFGVRPLRCPERLSDVVLNLAEEEEIKRIMFAIKEKERLYNEMFANQIHYGKGIKIMFYGPPGTGKTLAVKAISGELKIPMITLSLSHLMNPLVGMTEKLISKYFKAAKKYKAILFIDECDSLIMSRDYLSRSWEFSHINTLLKEIEDFDGVLILSTNYEEIRDKAINRRIHYFVKFNLPALEERKRLLEKMIPDQYKAGLDSEKICALEFSGGDLKNVWLRLSLRILCGESANTDMFAEELKKEREKSYIPENSNRCGF